MSKRQAAALLKKALEDLNLMHKKPNDFSWVDWDDLGDELVANYEKEREKL